jgi:glycerate 2-kinase
MMIRPKIPLRFNSTHLCRGASFLPVTPKFFRYVAVCVAVSAKASAPFSSVILHRRPRPVSAFFSKPFPFAAYRHSAQPWGHGLGTALPITASPIDQHARVLSNDARMTSSEETMTKDAIDCVHAAIRAVDPRRAIEQHVVPVQGSIGQCLLRVDGMVDSCLSETTKCRDRAQEQLECTDIGLIAMDETSLTLDLSQYENIVLIAFGKASSTMAVAILDQLEEALRNRNSTRPRMRGIVIAKYGHVSEKEAQSLAGYADIAVREAAHPVPDDNSVLASQAAIDLLREASSTPEIARRTLVFVAVSGGGSALLCRPVEPLSLSDMQEASRVLLGTGWNIQSVNTIRRRLEPQVKGGGLARAAAPARVVSLVLSDVLGDPLDRIASGPTVIPSPVEASYNEDDSVVQLVNSLSPRSFSPVVEEVLLRRTQQNSESRDFEQRRRTTHHLVGNNGIAVSAAAQMAKQKGYHPIVLTTQLEGEASQAAQFIVTIAEYVQQQASGTVTKRERPQASYSMTAVLPAALIAGGETTVTLPPGCDGAGGRNQELVLAAAQAMKTKGLRNIVVASVGTDGTDGPTDAAGGVVDGGTVDRLSNGSIEPVGALRNHNAYPYLAQCDSEGRSPLVKVCNTSCRKGVLEFSHTLACN